MSRSCHQHAETPAVGACYRCHQAICQSCAVRRPSLELDAEASPLACKALCEYRAPPPRAPRHHPRRFCWREFWRDNDAVAGLTVAAFILGVSIYEVITHPKGTSRGRSSRQRPRPKPATPAPSPPDLSAVRVGQRYIFDHDGYREVWTIESVAGGEVRYRCRREAPPNRAVIETLERWKAPPWELVFRDLKAPRAFGLKPGLSGDFLYWNSDARWDVYLVKGYRVVFPGLLKERPTRRGGKRVLVRVEPP